MKYKAYNKARDANEKDLFGILRSYGLSVFPLDQPCDGLVGYKSVLRLVEVKMPRNKKNEPRPFTATQIKFNDTWRGPLPTVLVTVDDAHEFANEILQEARANSLQNKVETYINKSGSEGATTPAKPEHKPLIRSE